MFVLAEDAFKHLATTPKNEAAPALAIESRAVRVIENPEVARHIEAYLGIVDDHDFDLGEYHKNEWASALSKTTGERTSGWLVFPATDSAKLVAKLKTIRITREDIANYNASDSVRAFHEKLIKTLSELQQGQFLVLRLPT